MTYSAIPGNNNKCECSNPGCPIHSGVSDCKGVATDLLFRIDMDDRTGTAMCEGCAEDAWPSGLFVTDPEDASDGE